MRFLVDNALSPLVAQRLREEGHDAVHVRDYQMQAAADEEIFRLSGNEQRVLVSSDTDFGTLLAAYQVRTPSVILFRRPSQRRPEEQVRTLLDNLPRMVDALAEGCIVSLEEFRLRIRILPITN